jgi:glycopeptide antibiotics resistance protein
VLIHSRAAGAGLAALALFVLYGSAGPFATGAPHVEALPGISLPDIAQNLLLYIPFGMLSVWTFRGSVSGRRGSYVLIVALAFLYSSAMELLQLRLAARIASPLDVISNVSGALIGAAAAERTEQVLQRGVDGAGRIGLLTAPARYLLAAVLAAIVIAAWYPFDVTLDVSTLSERTRAVRRDPWLWPSSFELFAQAARFFVLAALMTLCLPGLSRRRAPVATVVAVMIAGVVDLGQCAMGSQPIGVSALLSQSAGSLAGAAVGFAATSLRGT